jgi:hypothetical protein
MFLLANTAMFYVYGGPTLDVIYMTLGPPICEDGMFVQESYLKLIYAT